VADVTREFTLVVNSKGQIEAIKGFEKLDDSIEKTNTKLGENDRKQKAVAQATSNTTKAFAKQAQGLGGIVRIYATVAANVFALSSAFNVLKRNADLSILSEASRELSVATGQNYAGVARSLKEVTGGAITFRDAMQSANLALAGGFSGQQANQIADIATKAANALGRSVPEAVQRLTQAIVKGEPELADEFGIILRVTDATREYAKALGVLPQELTTAQRTQAIFNQFLEQGTEKFAEVDIKVNPYDRLASSFSELTNRIVELIRVPLDPFIGILADSGLALAGIFAGIAGGISKLLLPELRKLGEGLLTSAKATEALRLDTFAKRAKAAQQAVEALNADVFDYSEVVRAGVRDIDLSKVDFGKGIDSEQLIQELLDPESFGEGIRNEITRTVFKGDFNKQKGVIGNYVRGLEKAIETAASKGEASVKFRGLETSIDRARNALDLFRLGLESNEQTARRSGDADIGFWDRRTAAIKRATIAVKEFTSGVRVATSSGYAEGLQAGLGGILKEGILSDFKKFRDIVGGGKLRGSIGAIFGTGAKLAGGFLTTVTKLAGAFGAWGFALSAVLSVLSPIAEKFGLISKYGAEADKKVSAFADNVDLATDSVKRLKNISIETFQDQAKAAQVLSNLMKQYISDLENLSGVFTTIQNDIDNSFFARAFDLNEDRIETVLRSLKTRVNVIAEGLEKDTGLGSAKKFKESFEGTEVNLNELLRVDPEFAGQKGEELANRIQLKMLDAFDDNPELFERRNGQLIFKLGVGLADNALEEIAQVINRLGELSPEGLRTVSSILTEAATKPAEAVLENTEAITAADKAISTLGDKLDEQAVKIAGATPIYTEASRALKLVKEAASVEGAKFKPLDLDPISTPLLALAQKGLENPIKTLADFQEGLENLQQRELDSILTTDKLAASTAKYNSQLVAVKDLVNRGDLSAITTEFELQRKIKENTVEKLKQEKRELQDQKELAGTNAAKQLQLDEQIKRKTEEIQKTRNEINIQLGKSVELQKIGIKQAEAQRKITSLRLNSVQERAKVLDKIAKATDSTEDFNKRLNFEDQITAAKVAQLNATIALKQVQASRKLGAEAQALLEEVKLLEEKKKLVQEISEIDKLTKIRDRANKDLNFAFDQEKRLTKVRETTLNTEKERFELLASNKFLSNEVRDAAKLQSKYKAVAIAEEQRGIALKEIARINGLLTNEQEFIQSLIAEGYSIQEASKEVQVKQVELAQAKADAGQSELEIQKAQLALDEERFEIAKKNADLFRNPQEVQDLLGESFRRAAEDFGESMGNYIDRTVNLTLGVVDSGIDAFVDAVANGEDALKAATQAIGDTFLELNNQLVKDILKKSARDLLAGFFPGAKNLGKSEETQAQETGNNILKQIELNTRPGGAPGAPGAANPEEPGESMFTKISEYMKTTFQKVKDTFTEVGKNIGETVSKSFEGISDFIGDIDLGGIFDSISSAFSGLTSSLGSFFGGGGTGGFGGLAQTAISLFFAKGGITGEIMKRIPMYADGGVTAGPELAMVGEGPTREAIVPLPDNRSIPVTINGNPDGTKNIENKFNINITGVQGNEEGIKRSANQIALQIAREQQRAQGRIG